MKKILVSLLLFSTVLAFHSQAHATLVYQSSSSSNTPQSPHQQKVLQLIKERVNRAYQLAGQRDSFIMLCNHPKGQSKKNLRYASYAYFSSTGQNLATFETEYEKGFQEGISLFSQKSQTDQELVCAKLSQ